MIQTTRPAAARPKCPKIIGGRGPWPRRGWSFWAPLGRPLVPMTKPPPAGGRPSREAGPLLLLFPSLRALVRGRRTRPRAFATHARSAAHFIFHPLRRGHVSRGQRPVARRASRRR